MPSEAPSAPSAPTASAYDERLGVPLRWWALAAMFWASILVAFLVATPAWVALSATTVLVLATSTVFVSYGAARVTVRGSGPDAPAAVLAAGRASISVADLGEVCALDAERTRLQAGREADARAFLVLRPYLRTAVRVDIADPADPTPYWLVSTRHPQRLVAALEGHGARVRRQPR